MRSCLAVGYYVNDAGRLLAFAERWNGARWTAQPVPGPAGSRDSGLFAISCPAARACVAAGVSITRAKVPVTLAEAWNGTNWRIEPTPNPAGSRLSELLAVSCSSPGACTAAGNYATGAGQSATLAERWHGTRWAIQATPNPAKSLGTGLSAVSCSSARACTAAGNSTSSDTGAPVLLAEAWNGRAWRIQAAPQPTGPVGAFPGSVFTAVSCTSPGACTAAGWYISKTTQQVPLAERWNGTHWAIQAAPGVAKSLGTGLSAISCTGPGACVAAGSFTVVAPPAIIPGVALPAQTFAEAWHGTRWAIQPTPTRSGAAIFSMLSAVSCTSARACTAAGSSIDTADSVVPQAAGWNGRRWAIQPIPRPAGAIDAMLNGVSCTLARACTAVGSYAGRSLAGRAMAERWNGRRWAIQPIPRLPGALDALFAVSCTSPRACTAVGRAGKDTTLAVRWNGTRWAVQPTPRRVVANGAELAGVSCTSARACTAVGDYYTTAGQAVTLAERWNGTRWAVQPTPSPAGVTAALLSGVSCTSPLACTAVGFSMDQAGGQRTLAERWNGAQWAIQPTRGRAAGAELSDVSCASPRSCTAVGDYFLSNGATLMLAEDWHGAGWTLQASPRISGYDSGLFGVSCTAPGICSAAGFYYGLAGIPLNLAVATGFG
jgi:hypothetical protein